MRTVRSLAALAVVLAVAVSGCTDTARPKPLPSASPSPTSSASATPTPPTMPPEASGTSAKSAEAFVRYWIAVLNYSGRTRNSKPLRSLSSSKCLSCAGIADFIDAVNSKNGSIQGKGWIVRTIRTVDKAPDRVIVLDALVDVSPQTVRRRKGGPVQHFDGGRRLKTLYLQSVNGSWRVTRLDQPE